MRKNIIANIIGRFWSLLSAFLFIPLYINYLGFESYSIISFTLVIAGLMAVLDAGLSATLSREFARTDNNIEDKHKVFKTLESLFLIIIGLSVLVLILTSSYIAEHWLNVKLYNNYDVSMFLKIISFDIGFQLLLRFYTGGLLGLEKQVEANLYQVGWGMLRNGFVIVGIFIVPSLYMFFCWQTISTVIFTLATKLALEKKLYGRYLFNLQFNVDKNIFSKVWQFAGGMMLISIVAALNTQMDKLSISKFLTLESLGYYTLAISLATGFIVLISPISTALLPRFTALYSESKNIEASDLFLKVSLFISILVFAIMANMTFFGKELVWVWTGKMDIAQKVALVLPVVAFSYTMMSVAIIPFNIAIANGYTRLNNILGIISLIVTLPGYWFGTKLYGAIGAASVFCTVQTITTFVYLFFIDKKFLRIKSVKILFGKNIFLTLIISLCIAYLFSLIPNLFSNSRILTFMWVGLSTTITLVVCTLIFIPINEIKSMIKLKRI